VLVGATNPRVPSRATDAPALQRFVLAILRGVTNHQAPLRKPLRRVLLALAAALVAVLALPAVAVADTPADWATPPHVSGLEFLLVLVLIPLGTGLEISVLTILPSLIHDRGYEPGQSWRAEAEWFGGPRKGVDAADDLSPKQIETAESGRGGTSGEW
jgi:hypothetical protein